MAQGENQPESPNQSPDAGPCGSAARFPTIRTCVILTVAAAALWAAGLLVFPGVFADRATMMPALNASAILVWSLTMISILVVSIASPYGVKAFGMSFFVTIFVRMIGVFVGARILIYKEVIETGKPLAASLALMYLPLLLIEVAIMAAYLKNLGMLGNATGTLTNPVNESDSTKNASADAATTDAPPTDPSPNTDPKEVSA